MRKSIMLFAAFAAMLMSSCSQNSENGDGNDGEKTSFTVKFDFGEATGKTRAAQSTAIPATSWSNIKQVQLFLYDVSNKIAFSEVITPSAAGDYTYTNVPVGTYTVVAVANAKSSTDPITTYLDGGTTAEEWTMWNVRQKLATNMVLKHKTGTFPSFSPSELTDANAAYEMPAEIFMGSATGVSVSTTGLATAAITLKREVSLMRVRVDKQTNTMVDFSQNASIMLHRIPTSMNIVNGAGAVSGKDDILVASGAGTFKTSDPATGYAPTTILGGTFTLWNDLVVFPNATRGEAAGNAAADRQYFIVISGLGQNGHVLADGTVLTTPKTVYWSGTVKEKFLSNIIREVNLTLQSGGSTEPPVDPTESGSLQITVSTPAAWDSNIVASDIIL